MYMVCNEQYIYTIHRYIHTHTICILIILARTCVRKFKNKMVLGIPLVWYICMYIIWYMGYMGIRGECDIWYC